MVRTAMFLPLIAISTILSATQQQIVEGARAQLSWGTHYDGSYRKIRIRKKTFYELPPGALSGTIDFRFAEV